MSFLKHEKWMEGYALKKWESTLELSVHAHGPDVELIMELHNFLWVVHQVLHSHWFQFFMGSELLVAQEHR